VPTIVVTAETEGAGKTGVAAAIARHYAYQGRPTKLVRLPGAGHAAEDAAYFASLDFVPGSPPQAGHPPQAAANELLVVEASAGAAPSIDGTVVSVARSDTGVTTSIAGREGSFAIPIDRTLAGFTIDDVQRLISAEVLVEGDGAPGSCDHLVIAPIGSDAGEPYFRRFQSFAVVVRFDRTDMHLAAIKGGANLLILTGGRRPMDYLFDVASAEAVPVLLALTDTENTVIALEPVFDNTRFSGERKLDRMANLLQVAGFFEALPAIPVAAR
jgi:BioD-like phosphotransacetylase family protein